MQTAKTDQPGLSLRWGHRKFCWFCLAAALSHILEFINLLWVRKKNFTDRQTLLFLIGQVRGSKDIFNGGLTKTYFLGQVSCQPAQTQKSPASRLAADLKVSCQPATITYQIKHFIGIYVQLCLKSSNPILIFKSFLFLTWICWAVLKPIQVSTVLKLSFSNWSDGLTITLMMTWIIISVIWPEFMRVRWCGTL